MLLCSTIVSLPVVVSDRATFGHSRYDPTVLRTRHSNSRRSISPRPFFIECTLQLAKSLGKRFARNSMQRNRRRDLVSRGILTACRSTAGARIYLSLNALEC
jgi:hypothetical protein